MSASVAVSPTRPGWLARVLHAGFSLIVGALLCMTAVGSVLVLGRAMRVMRGVATGQGGHAGWILGPRGHGWATRLLGGLAANIREGLSAALSLGLATFPVTAFWMTSWWAGWENSFNKGYEQAFVGPALGFTGIAVFVAILLHLPLALAHQAAENRALAVFELRSVRRIVRHAGWGHVWLALFTAFCALPIFAGRGLVVFGEGIFPGLADMGPEQVAELSGTINLALGAYVFVSFMILKRWAARVYADARARADAGRVPWRSGRAIRSGLILAAWAGVAVLIFVGQFLNHDWHVWMTHPYVFLPWVM